MGVEKGIKYPDSWEQYHIGLSHLSTRACQSQALRPARLPVIEATV